ncbi:hypothetical protein [Leisingera sp. S232]|uniref:hypothetical protein n=1 Tax=Leisingera sp. S232 TaxID=3415132 RepID=UPI003C7A548A
MRIPQLIKDYLDAPRISPQGGIEINERAAVHALVGGNAGVSILPGSEAEWPPDFCMLRIQDLSRFLTQFLICRGDRKSF